MEIEFCLMLIFEILIIHLHEVPHKNRFSRHDVYWTLLHLRTKRNSINKISILGDLNGVVRLVKETFLAINFVITLSAKY